MLISLNKDSSYATRYVFVVLNGPVTVQINFLWLYNRVQNLCLANVLESSIMYYCKTNVLFVHCPWMP